MEKKLVPTCKYKTSVIFFDDDIEFLEYLKDSIISTKYNYFFVNNLQYFTNIINKSSDIKNKLPCILSSIDNEMSDLSHSEALCVDLSKLVNIKNSMEKENEVSVVIVDRNLGDLDGIKVCSNLNDNTVERILLTGDCDYTDAITALNEKNIELFVDKMPFYTKFNTLSEYDIGEKLLKNIDAAVDRYFINKDSYNNKLLSNLEFKKLYSNIVSSHSIVAHYLVKKDTLLLINMDNQEFIFKCWTLNDFDDYYNMHYDELDLIGSSRLVSIKEERKLPIGADLIESLNFGNLYYFLVESKFCEN